MLKTNKLSYSTLLSEITLSFEPGKVHGLLGPNGAGKSTLLKNLACIWQPTSGSLTWNNSDLLTMDRRAISRILTLVPQNPQLSFDYTVEEFVAMGRYAQGCRLSTPIDQALEAADALLFKKRPMTRLSQGERQRVYIARSLATEAPVLLFDEPAANLDIRHQIDIWHLLRKLAAQGKTVIVANHDLPSSKRYCDHIYILRDGRCVAEGRYDTVMTKESLKENFSVSEAESFLCDLCGEKN